MALSTSIPIPRVRPPKLIRLRVIPVKYIRAIVVIIEIGIARPTTRVDLKFLKNR